MPEDRSRGRVRTAPATDVAVAVESPCSHQLEGGAHARQRSHDVVASAPVLAGAGRAAAPGTLTTAQVITRGSAICHAAEHRVDTTPGPRSQNPFAKTAPKGDAQRAIRFMAVYASALESVRVRLGRLDAPPAGRDHC